MKQGSAITISLRDFEKEYCADILERGRFLGSFSMADGIFDFEGTEDGEPVIYAKDGTSIPLHDVTTMSREDFRAAYPKASPREAFTNYLSNYTVRTAADAIFEHNRSLREAASRSQLAAKLLDCDFSAM
jgi:hypothetical protein